MIVTIRTDIPDLGKRITEARKHQEMTAPQLASKCELTPAHIYKIEKEEIKALPYETLRKIETALGVEFGVKFNG